MELDNQVYLQDLLGWVKTNQFSINLPTGHILFLLAIYTLQRSNETELNEDVLIDLYRQVMLDKDDSLTEKALASAANKLINEFVSQKLMNRFSLNFENEGLLDAASIYRLSPLAIGIAEHYCRQKEFSNVGLSVQLAIVAKEMQEITNNLNTVDKAHFWRLNIWAPLRFSVAEVFDLIDYRQRQLDQEQEEVKTQVTNLLSQKNWQFAIESCQRLLENTGKTLRELQDTLSSAGDKLQAQLISIVHALAVQSEAINLVDMFVQDPSLRTTLHRDETDKLAMVDTFSQFSAEERAELVKVFNGISDLVAHLQNNLDRIISWGQHQIDLWTGFDKHIHKFIRTSIDLDKNRVFSNRIARSVSDFLEAPWYLTYTSQERILDLRADTEVLVEGEELGEMPEEITYETYDNIQEHIASAMQVILAPYRAQKVPLNLAEVLQTVLRENPLSMHFDLTRILLDQALKMGMSTEELSGIQAQWQAVNDNHAQIQANVLNRYFISVGDPHQGSVPADGKPTLETLG